MNLFADPVPVLPALIDLRCCDVRAMLAAANGASLIIADPAWSEYDPGSGGVQGNGSINARPSNHYICRSLDDIAEDLRLAHQTGAARLVLWHCWPLVCEALEDMVRCARDGVVPSTNALTILGPWRAKTGGAWTKTQEQWGVGHHWLGHSEPVIVCVSEGVARDRAEAWRNPKAECRSGVEADPVGHASVPGAHSAKPEDWHAAMIRRWVPPGGLVVDLYAGLGGVARAVLAAGEGRRYLGSEISPERHAKAIGLTALRRAA